jgi:hypothetical protein
VPRPAPSHRRQFGLEPSRGVGRQHSHRQPRATHGRTGKRKCVTRSVGMHTVGLSSSTSLEDMAPKKGRRSRITKGTRSWRPRRAAELEAMAGDRAGGDRDMTFAGSGWCLLHCFRHFAGDEGEGCVRVGSAPVRGHLVWSRRRPAHSWCSPVPAVGDIEMPGDWATALTTAPSSRTKVTSDKLEKADRMLARRCPARCRVPVTAAASLRPARGVRHRRGTPSARRSRRLRPARCG